MPMTADLPTRTQQHMAAATDVNLIVKNFQRTGVMSHTSNKMPAYADVSSSEDLFTAINTVNAANDEFNDLPSEVRRAAENDPQMFLAMVESDEGLEILVEAGLETAEGWEPVGEAPAAPVEQPEIPVAVTDPAP